MSIHKEVLSDTVTLYRGDSREVLASGEVPQVDLVATDPPYGIAYETNYRKVLDKPDMLEGDDEPPLWFIAQAAALLRPGGALYVCTRFDVSPLWIGAIKGCGLKLKTTIVWDKTNHTAGDLEGDYGNQTEFVLFAHDGKHKLRERRDVNLWRIPRPHAGEHPTPKPVGLMSRIIRNSSDANDIVLDPFMGSGTTGVSCVNTGRRFVGVEYSPKYFDICCRRISNVLRQPDFFVPARPVVAVQSHFIL